MKKESGQAVIILLLIMVLALAIGLSIIGRSVNEIAISNKTEESSRAFSAAEAGIEKLLLPNPSYDTGVGNLGVIPLDNQSAFQAGWNAQLPKAQTALEYPPFGKESFAQFWLADPPTASTSAKYTQGNFELYFGNPNPGNDSSYYVSKPSDAPAVEVAVIIKDAAAYSSKKYFYDTYSTTPGGDGTRRDNGFFPCEENYPKIETNDSGSPNRSFFCKVTVPPTGSYLSGLSVGSYPVMARVRILYSEISHQVALKPTGGCGDNCSLPYQAKILTSAGTSGNTQRRLQVFREKSVMPPFFDYAIFSAGALDKQ